MPHKHYTHIGMKFNSIKQFILLFFVLMLSLSIDAQDLESSSKSLNDRLYNGKLYSYFPPKAVVGNQYLFSPRYEKGVIWMDSKAYANLLLNFDILNQQLLLSFKNSQGAHSIISLSMAYVDSFSLNHKLFIVKRNQNNDISIYQRIQFGNSKLLIRWTKYLNLRTSLSTIEYEFSEPIKSLYFVNKNESLHSIRNNVTLRKLFSKQNASALKKYMRSNKMKLAKMSDDQYLQLLKFIKTLPDA